MHKLKPIHRDLFICFFLVIITVAVFWQVSGLDFVRYDDDKYVTENSHVQAGLTRSGIVWAFSSVYANNWHPLTWISHMVDCQLFSTNPAGPHLVNLFLHIVNTLLLFIVLKRMTDLPWRSAFVATLFAVHPLHVESVAWVSERKDVLSTFFFMMSTWAYVRYVERPDISRYLAILVLFALGLMSKPMLVTFPFVLLLLDFWPLHRLWLEEPIFKMVPKDVKIVSIASGKRTTLGLIIEKAPLFILTGASICMTLFAQWSGIATTESLPLFTRVGNAIVTYVSYIGKMFWPAGLAVFYPYPETIPLWQIAGTILILVLITAAAIRLRKSRPYLLTGWMWYLGTLIPVIGLVQVGYQSMADRYTYIPLIGIFIAIAWTVPDILGRLRVSRIVLPALTACLIAVLITVSFFQVRYWRNSMALFTHALAVTKNNYVMETNMGAALAEQGRFEEAVSHYQEALRVKPDDFEARYNLANALARQGRLEEAVSQYAVVLQKQPDAAAAHNNMGIALAQLGKADEAIPHFREAIRIKPDFRDAGANLERALSKQAATKRTVPQKIAIEQTDPSTAEGQLRMGLTLLQEGKADEAIPKFEEALRLNPNLVAAHVSLGLVMAQKRNLDKAIYHFRKALKIKPDIAETHNSLGVALTYKGALDEAIEHFHTAIKLNPKFAKAHNSLAVALVQKGKTEEAIGHLRKAVEIQPDYDEAKKNLKILLDSQGK
ncbi:MAG TPA: tetratricopeptide repeat protein [Syntrophales bacterium]|nr:tetratricopeptide repeat protein [Syntrophales bacterium]